MNKKKGWQLQPAAAIQLQRIHNRKKLIYLLEDKIDLVDEGGEFNIYRNL